MDMGKTNLAASPPANPQEDFPTAAALLRQQRKSPSPSLAGLLATAPGAADTVKSTRGRSVITTECKEATGVPRRSSSNVGREEYLRQVVEVAAAPFPGSSVTSLKGLLASAPPRVPSVSASPRVTETPLTPVRAGSVPPPSAATTVTAAVAPAVDPAAVLASAAAPAPPPQQPLIAAAAATPIVIPHGVSDVPGGEGGAATSLSGRSLSPCTSFASSVSMKRRSLTIDISAASEASSNEDESSSNGAGSDGSGGEDGGGDVTGADDEDDDGYVADCSNPGWSTQRSKPAAATGSGSGGQKQGGGSGSGSWGKKMSKRPPTPGACLGKPLPILAKDGYGSGEDDGDLEDEYGEATEAEQLRITAAVKKSKVNKRLPTPGAALGRPVSIFSSRQDSSSSSRSLQPGKGSIGEAVGCAEVQAGGQKGPVCRFSDAHQVKVFEGGEGEEEEEGIDEDASCPAVHFSMGAKGSNAAEGKKGAKGHPPTPGAGLGRPVSIFSSPTTSSSSSAIPGINSNGTPESAARGSDAAIDSALEGSGPKSAKKHPGTPGVALGKPISIFKESSSTAHRSSIVNDGEPSQQGAWAVSQGRSPAKSDKKHPGTPGVALGKPISIFKDSGSSNARRSSSMDDGEPPQQFEPAINQGRSPPKASKKHPGTPGVALGKPVSIFKESGSSSSARRGSVGDGAVTILQGPQNQATCKQPKQHPGTPGNALGKPISIFKEGSSSMRRSSSSSCSWTDSGGSQVRFSLTGAEVGKDAEEGISTHVQFSTPSTAPRGEVGLAAAAGVGGPKKGSKGHPATPGVGLGKPVSMFKEQGTDSMRRSSSEGPELGAASAPKVQFAAGGAIATRADSAPAPTHAISPGKVAKGHPPTPGAALGKPISIFKQEGSADGVEEETKGSSPDSSSPISPIVQFKTQTSNSTAAVTARGGIIAAAATKKPSKVHPATPGVGLGKPVSIFKEGGSSNSSSIARRHSQGEVEEPPSKSAGLQFAAASPSTPVRSTSGNRRNSKGHPATPGAGLGKPVSIFSSPSSSSRIPNLGQQASPQSEDGHGVLKAADLSFSGVQFAIPAVTEQPPTAPVPARGSSAKTLRFSKEWELQAGEEDGAQAGKALRFTGEEVIAPVARATSMGVPPPVVPAKALRFSKEDIVMSAAPPADAGCAGDHVNLSKAVRFSKEEVVTPVAAEHTSYEVASARAVRFSRDDVVIPGAAAAAAGGGDGYHSHSNTGSNRAVRFSRDEAVIPAAESDEAHGSAQPSSARAVRFSRDEVVIPTQPDAEECRPRSASNSRSSSGGRGNGVCFAADAKGNAMPQVQFAVAAAAASSSSPEKAAAAAAQQLEWELKLNKHPLTPHVLAGMQRESCRVVGFDNAQGQAPAQLELPGPLKEHAATAGSSSCNSSSCMPPQLQEGQLVGMQSSSTSRSTADKAGTSQQHSVEHPLAASPAQLSLMQHNPALACELLEAGVERSCSPTDSGSNRSSGQPGRSWAEKLANRPPTPGMPLGPPVNIFKTHGQGRARETAAAAAAAVAASSSPRAGPVPPEQHALVAAATVRVQQAAPSLTELLAKHNKDLACEMEEQGVLVHGNGIEGASSSSLGKGLAQNSDVSSSSTSPSKKPKSWADKLSHRPPTPGVSLGKPVSNFAGATSDAAAVFALAEAAEALQEQQQVPAVHGEPHRGQPEPEEEQQQQKLEPSSSDDDVGDEPPVEVPKLILNFQSIRRSPEPSKPSSSSASGGPSSGISATMTSSTAQAPAEISSAAAGWKAGGKATPQQQHQQPSSDAGRKSPALKMLLGRNADLATEVKEATRRSKGDARAPTPGATLGKPYNMFRDEGDDEDGEEGHDAEEWDEGAAAEQRGENSSTEQPQAGSTSTSSSSAAAGRASLALKMLLGHNADLATEIKEAKQRAKGSARAPTPGATLGKPYNMFRDDSDDDEGDAEEEQQQEQEQTMEAASSIIADQSPPALKVLLGKNAALAAEIKEAKQKAKGNPRAPTPGATLGRPYNMFKGGNDGEDEAEEEVPPLQQQQVQEPKVPQTAQASTSAPPSQSSPALKARLGLNPDLATEIKEAKQRAKGNSRAPTPGATLGRPYNMFRDGTDDEAEEEEQQLQQQQQEEEQALQAAQASSSMPAGQKPAAFKALLGKNADLATEIKEAKQKAKGNARAPTPGATLGRPYNMFRDDSADEEEPEEQQQLGHGIAQVVEQQQQQLDQQHNVKEHSHSRNSSPAAAPSPPAVKMMVSHNADLATEVREAKMRAKGNPRAPTPGATLGRPYNMFRDDSDEEDAADGQLQQQVQSQQASKQEGSSKGGAIAARSSSCGGGSVDGGRGFGAASPRSQSPDPMAGSKAACAPEGFVSNPREASEISASAANPASTRAGSGSLVNVSANNGAVPVSDKTKGCSSPTAGKSSRRSSRGNSPLKNVTKPEVEEGNKGTSPLSRSSSPADNRPARSSPLRQMVAAPGCYIRCDLAED